MSSLPVPRPHTFNSLLIQDGRNTGALKWNNFAECRDLVAFMKETLLQLRATATDARRVKETHAELE